MPGGQAGRLLRVLHGESLEPPPWWLMRQAGRYLPEYRKLREGAPSFIDFCLNPALAAEATLQPVQRFGMNAAIVFADILLLPLALGQSVGFDESGPRLQPIEKAAHLRGLDLRRLTRLEPVYETLRRCRFALPADTAL